MLDLTLTSYLIKALPLKTFSHISVTHYIINFQGIQYKDLECIC